MSQPLKTVHSPHNGDGDQALRRAISSNDALLLERELKTATAAGASAVLLREAVLKLASVGESTTVTQSPSNAAQPPPSESDTMRHWLQHIVGLDSRIVERTASALEKEECFTVSDVVLLAKLPRFEEIFTAVTRTKLWAALRAPEDATPQLPVAPDDSIPAWLTEASAMLDPVTSGAQAPAPAAVSQQPRQPRRRSSSFSSRRPRGERARAASPAPLLTKGGNGRDNGGSSGDGDGGDGSGVASTPTTASDRATEGGALTVGKVCKFYLRGMCHFGSKCRNLHPDGQEGSAIVCAACGERGHKLKDCMKGGLAAACGPVAADARAARARGRRAAVLLPRGRRHVAVPERDAVAAAVGDAAVAESKDLSPRDRATR